MLLPASARAWSPDRPPDHGTQAAAMTAGLRRRGSAPDDDSRPRCPGHAHHVSGSRMRVEAAAWTLILSLWAAGRRGGCKQGIRRCRLFASVTDLGGDAYARGRPTFLL
jgi:hypothetical protein